MQAESSRSRRPWLRAFVLLDMIAFLTSASLTTPDPVTAAITLVIALFAPGFALVSVFVRRDAFDSAILTAGLSVVLSAATYVLIGLGFAAAGMRLDQTHFVVATDCVVAFGCIAMLVARRCRITSAARPVRTWVADWGVPLCALAGACAVVLGFANMRAPQPDPFQAIYVTDRGIASGGLVDVRAGISTVRLAVVNRTGRDRGYELTGSLSDGTDWPTRRIAVHDGATWTGELSGRVAPFECSLRVRINLEDLATKKPVADLTLRFQGAQAGSRTPEC